MVAANATVDIPALKARHPLANVVEAAGVKLRGRGRVRQGLCPFHDEAEGSFTAYGDSQRWYCFGCGTGGDVIDFVQRLEGLTLPEAIARLDGDHGPVSGAAPRTVATQGPKSAALPPRDPALLTAAARFYAGQLRRHSEARGYLASRGVVPVASARLGLGYSPCNGLRQALESQGFTADTIRDSALFTDRGAERFSGMVVVPEVSSGLVRWLKGRSLNEDVKPRFQALPGPKPVLGVGRLGLAPSWAVVTEGVFDWIALAQWGIPSCAALGTQGSGTHRVGSGRVAPASSSPSTTTTRALRRRSGFSWLAWTQGRRRNSPPGRRRCGLSLPRSSTGEASSSACLHGRPAPPASGCPPLS